MRLFRFIGRKLNLKDSSNKTAWEYKWGRTLPFDQSKPFLGVIETAGFKLDHPLHLAMVIGWSRYSKGALLDNVLFRELARMDIEVLRPLVKDIGETSFFSWFQNFVVEPNPVPTLSALLYDVFGRVSSELPKGSTITADEIASAILADALSGHPLLTAGALVLAYQESFGLETLGECVVRIGPKLHGHLAKITGLSCSVED